MGACDSPEHWYSEIAQSEWPRHHCELPRTKQLDRCYLRDGAGTRKTPTPQVMPVELILASF